MKENNKILIVDDEPDILEILKYNLEKGKYKIFTANNGKEAITVANDKSPDLIILDVMMPEMNGIEVCKLLRKSSKFDNTIILFLTALSEEYSEVSGFEAGADDYVTKPIRPKTLVARVKTLLKRNAKTKKTVSNIVIGALEIDFEKRRILKNDIEILLPRKEFQLLELLALSPDKVFTRDEIYNAVWGNKIIVGDRTLDVHIRKLRKKIGEEYIRTSKGVGYSFNSNIE
jgi:two-component system alkaline phosphatase synthesis response regulator PhoP